MVIAVDRERRVTQRPVRVVPEEPAWLKEQIKYAYSKKEQAPRQSFHVTRITDFYWGLFPIYEARLSHTPRQVRADAGTLVHKAMEANHNPEVAVPSPEEVRTKLGVHAHEWYQHRIQNADRAEQLLPKGTSSLVEQKVTIHLPGESYEFFGQTDRVIQHGNNTQTVVEYKCGAVHNKDGTPAAIHALQVGAYTLGLGVNKCNPPILVSLSTGIAYRLLPKEVSDILNNPDLKDNEKRAQAEMVRRDATRAMYSALSNAMRLGHEAVEAKEAHAENAGKLRDAAQDAYLAFERLIGWEELSHKQRELWQPTAPDVKPTVPSNYVYDELVDRILFEHLGKALPSKERQRFLEPKVRDLTIRNVHGEEGRETKRLEMKKAAEFVKLAKLQKKHIHICATPDVDGVLTAALLQKGLNVPKGRVTTNFLKDSETSQDIDSLKKDDLLIVINSGSKTMYEKIKKAKAQGAHVILIDRTKPFPADAVLYTPELPATVEAYMLIREASHRKGSKTLVNMLPLTMLAVRADEFNKTVTQQTRPFDKLGFRKWTERQSPFLRALEKAAFADLGEKPSLSEERVISYVIRMLKVAVKKMGDPLLFANALVSENEQIISQAIEQIVLFFKKEEKALAEKQDFPPLRRSRIYPINPADCIPIELFCKHVGNGYDDATPEFYRYIDEEVGPFSDKFRRPKLPVRFMLREVLPEKRRTLVLMSNDTNGYFPGAFFAPPDILERMLGQEVVAHAQFGYDWNKTPQAILTNVQLAPQPHIPFPEFLENSRRSGLIA